MTDQIAAFLAEQKRLADDASPAPWVSHLLEGEKAEPILTPSEDVAWEPRWYIPRLAWTAERADTEFIIAARSSHPRMVKALEAVLNHATKQRDEIRTSFKETGAAPARELGYADACDDVIAFITAALEGEETNE